MRRGQCGHVVDLLAIECRHCRHWFFLCRRCYHGERYCGKRCRKAARKAQNDTARKKHIDKDPEAARRNHAERQRRYRQQQRQRQQLAQQQQDGNANADADALRSAENAEQSRADEECVTDQPTTPDREQLSQWAGDEARAFGGEQGPGKPPIRRWRRCQRCHRRGRVVLWVRWFDPTPSLRRAVEMKVESHGATHDESTDHLGAPPAAH